MRPRPTAALAIMAAMSEAAAKPDAAPGPALGGPRPRPAPDRARLHDRRHLDPEGEHNGRPRRRDRRSAGIFGGVPQEGDRLGSADAPVTIQVFNDMQCSSCREAFLSTIPKLAEKYARPGRGQLLCRHYSNSENPQELGFYGAEAAAEQGYGWQYIYLFFRNQDEAERFGVDRGLPRVGRRRGRGTRTRRNGSRPRRRPAAPTARSTKRLEGRRGTGAGPRHPRRPGG